MTKHELSSCLKFLDSTERILAITHRDPDGDAIGSLLALGAALDQKHKRVQLVCVDPIPAVFTFLPQSNRIIREPTADNWDTIITVDCGDLKRTGLSELVMIYGKKERLLNLDHHPKSDLSKIATLHLGDDGIAATAQILVDIFMKWDVTMTKEIAACLMTGLYTDTGGFKHTNTTTKTLEYAAYLMEKGARLHKITKNLLNNKPVSALKLWGIILNRLKTNRRHGVVSSVVTLRDLKTCDASLDDLSGAVNLMNTIPDSRVALLLTETADGSLKASLRTEDTSIDVSQIAMLFGGGGHKKASGFTIPGRLHLDQDQWKIVMG